MYLNETLNTKRDVDFFEELYSESVFKQVTIGIFFFGSIVGSILLVGIVWYERNGPHRYRTVLNQLFSTISWVSICYLLLVYVPEGTRYLIGPLPETFCDFHHSVKNFFTCCVTLAFDAIICLKYVIIFKWGRFSVFDDNFIVIFLKMSIFGLSFWMTLIKRMSVGRRSLNYFMCAGKNPNDMHDEDSTEPISTQYDTTGFLVLVSFLLHIIISVKIFVYEHRMEKRTRRVELGRMNSGISNDNNQERKVAWEENKENSTRRNSNLSKSMVDLTTLILCLAFLSVAAIITKIMNRTNPKELNLYENRWLAYFNQVIFVSFGILGICFQYYAKNATLRNLIWRNLKALIQKP